jgi:hypothetical protein
VRGAGLEPARYFYHEPLKIACLPFHHPRTLADYFLKPAKTPAGAARDWTLPPYFCAGAAGAGTAGATGFSIGAGLAGTALFRAGRSKMLLVTCLVDA